MSETILLHAVRRDENTVLLAPRLARYSLDPVVGAIVDANTLIGRAYIVERSLAVRLPAGVSGRVVSIASRARRSPFEHGAELLVLSPIAAAHGDDRHAHHGDATASGAIEFVAPMDGQFYRRPTPNDPPFVADGTVVQPGERIGLIEVMKFFYPIRWEGSEPVRLVRFVVGDAAAVSAGQTLAVFEPA